MCRWSPAEHTHGPGPPTGGATSRAAGCYGPRLVGTRQAPRAAPACALSPRPTWRPIALTPPTRGTLGLPLVIGPLPPPPPVAASRSQITIMQDDNQLLGSNGNRRDAALDEWTSL